MRSSTAVDRGEAGYKDLRHRNSSCRWGWRTLSFLKVLTDDGLVGWSEFHESFASGRRVSLLLGATAVDGGGGSGHDRSLAFGCRSL